MAAELSIGSRLRQTFDRVPAKVRNRALVSIVFAGALMFPYISQNQGNIDAAANACAFAALALGLNIVVGFAGLLDLGYAAFFAIGAYFYGVLNSYQLTPPWSELWVPMQWLGLVSRTHIAGIPDTVHFQFSFWLMVPASALLAAFFGVLFGYPTLKLRGDYLAIVTLGFGEIVPIVARNTPSVTAGAAGLNGIGSPHLFGYNFGLNATPYYYFGIGLIAFLIFTSHRLRDSRIGRAWMAIREDEVAAGAMGVDRRKLKLLAFAIGAAFAGVTGTFYIAKLQTATPDMFMFPVSVMVLAMVVLGGMGNIWGVVIGAILLQLLQSWFLQDLSSWAHALGRFLHNDWLQQVQFAQAIELIFGFILVFMMLYRRGGLVAAPRSVTALSLAEQTGTVNRGGISSVLHGMEKSEAEVAGAAMLETKKLTMTFGGIKALTDVDLRIEPDSIVGLIGPNGSGKTTLFNLITGMDEPVGGEILFLGRSIGGLPAHEIVEAGIARTFQNQRLFNQMTVLENVLVGTHVRTHTGPLGAVVRPPSVRAEEREAAEWAMEVLTVFGNRLMPRVNHVASSLSYANRRRLEIARALASRPRLLLLDEPTAGMNPAETLELAEQIHSLRDMGLTIFLIEHKMNVVNDIADKLVVLDHGVKLVEGSAEVVHSNEDVIRAYLGRSASATAA